MDQVEHFYGLVPVRWIANEPRFLMFRTWHLWTFPRYKVEDSSPQGVAALLKDEIGLEQVDWRLGEEVMSTRPYSRGYVDNYYLGYHEFGEAQLPISPLSNVPVFDEFRWLRHREARAKLRAPIRPIVDWAYETTVKLTQPEPNRKTLRTHLGLGSRRKQELNTGIFE